MTIAVNELVVELHIGSNVYVFDGKTAVDQGQWIAPRQTHIQNNFVATCESLPDVLVYLRPDQWPSDPPRFEFIVELGQIGKTPYNLGSYVAKLYHSDALIATVNVPKHDWWSRWRWFSKPRPIIRTVDSMIMDKLIPPFALTGKTAPGMPEWTPTPMALYGVNPAMGTTGERNDIGLVTGWQAAYIHSGTSAHLLSVMQTAEASAAFPWHFRDRGTLAPLDLEAFPTAGYQFGYNPRILLAGTGKTCDNAHQPALSHIAYLLTNDLFHLEEHQFANVHSLLDRPGAYRFNPLYGYGQPRAEGWWLRTLSTLVKSMPASRVPRGLLPKAYWTRMLDRLANWQIAKFVNDPWWVRQAYRTTDSQDNGTDPTYIIAPWQDCFRVSALGYALHMGFEQFRTSFNWQIKGVIDRTSADSGWGRNYPAPYRVLLREGVGSPIAGDWDDAWRLNLESNVIPSGLKSSLKITYGKFVIDPKTGLPVDPDDISPSLSDLTYYYYTRGELVWANRYGIPGAMNNLHWLMGEFARLGVQPPEKWRFL